MARPALVAGPSQLEWDSQLDSSPDDVGLVPSHKRGEDGNLPVVAVTRGEVVYSGAANEARSHASVLRAFLGEAALAE